MKIRQIQVQINQLAGEIEKAINAEPGLNETCRLQDAKEHMRRAWKILEGVPCQFNDLILDPENP